MTPEEIQEAIQTIIDTLALLQGRQFAVEFLIANVAYRLDLGEDFWRSCESQQLTELSENPLAFEGFRAAIASIRDAVAGAGTE